MRDLDVGDFICNSTDGLGFKFFYKNFRSDPWPIDYFGSETKNAVLGDNTELRIQAFLPRCPTFSTAFQVNNYEHILAENGRRGVASACGRRTAQSRISSATPSSSSSDARRRRITERELSRIIRRLQVEELNDSNVFSILNDESASPFCLLLSLI